VSTAPVDPAITASPSRKRRAKAQQQPQIVVVHKQIAEKAKSLTDARRDYEENLGTVSGRFDAADPSNRFMRRRDGLGGSGDAHLPQSQLWRVREISRHMVGNDDLLGQMLSRLTDNVIQSNGFRFCPATGDSVLDDELAKMWTEYAANPLACDYYGERDLSAQAWLAFFQMVQDGDMFALCVDDGTVQLIEADRCQTTGGTADSWLGLSFDPKGRVTDYHFTETQHGQFAAPNLGKGRTIAARDADGFRQVCHLMDPRRVTQHRGYPWITPLMVKSGMLDDLQFSTIVKAQSAAAHAIFFEREAGTSGGPVRIGGRETISKATPDGGSEDVTTETVRYGMATTLPAGVKAKLATAPIPNQEHFEHVRHLIRQIGAGLNMPLEMVLLDASQTNFSGWRGAMDQARMSFVRNQRAFATQFYTPICRMWLRRQANTSATIRAAHFDGSLYRFRFASPAWPYINPKEDAEAANVMVTTGQDSPRGIVAKRGGSYDDVIRETVADRGKALRLAIAESQSIKADLNYEVSPLLILGWDLAANTGGVANQDELANSQSAGGRPLTQSPAPAPAPEPDDDDGDANDDGRAFDPAALTLTVAREMGNAITTAITSMPAPSFTVNLPSPGNKVIVRDASGRITGTKDAKDGDA
jgi:lambda family phage portal protein